MNAPDEELIRLCLNGRAEAFGDLVRRYQDRLHHSLYRLLGSREDALDAVQEAFVLAFQKLGSFRGDSQFYSWLFRIGYNAAVSGKRRERLKTRSLDAVREQSGSDPDDARTDQLPSHAMEVAEQQALVQQALSELPEEYRDVIVMKEMEDLSYEEIATLMDVPIGTVRSRLHRGRGELREKLRLLLGSE